MNYRANRIFCVGGALAVLLISGTTTFADATSLVQWKGAYFKTIGAERPADWTARYGADARFGQQWVGDNGTGQFIGRDGVLYQANERNSTPDAKPIWAKKNLNSASRVVLQHQDLDGDGADDDSIISYQFSLSQELNPEKVPNAAWPDQPVYHAELPSGRFYGGMTGNYFNFQSKSFGQAFVEPWGGVWAPGLSPRWGPADDIAIGVYWDPYNGYLEPDADTTDNEATFASALIWKKEDFLNGGAQSRVTLDSTSSFSFLSTRWWDHMGEVRWIIYEGDQLYVSEHSVPGQMDFYGESPNIFNDPMSTRWAVYNPSGIDLEFDVDAVTEWLDPVAAGLFTDIDGFGLYLEQDTRFSELNPGEQSRVSFSIDDIQFNATTVSSSASVVPLPSSAALLIASAMLAMCKRRRNF